MTDQEFEKLFRESSNAEKLLLCRFCARVYEGEKIALRAQVLEKEIENGILYDVLKRLAKDKEATR